eukprot:9822963-Ditylum_brightwellii.AAC.1
MSAQEDCFNVVNIGVVLPSRTEALSSPPNMCNACSVIRHSIPSSSECTCYSIMENICKRSSLQALFIANP